MLSFSTGAGRAGPEASETTVAPSPWRVRRSCRPIVYDLARLSRLRCFAFFDWAGRTLFASADMDFEKSEPGSDSTAGVPRFTDTGTARSDGTSAAIVTFSAAS